MTPSAAEQIRLQLCGQCGKRAPGTARFCPRCGTRLRPGSPGDNTYLAVHKALKDRSAAREAEPLVIPRPVIAAAPSQKTRVLGYEPPQPKKPKYQPPAPRQKKSPAWIWLMVLGAGIRAATSFSTNSSSSSSTSSYNYPPPRSYATPPAYRVNTPPGSATTPPRQPLSPTFTSPAEQSLPRPGQPRPIPGTSLSIDERGHVIVNPSARPMTPAFPTPPSPYGPSASPPPSSPSRPQPGGRR